MSWFLEKVPYERTHFGQVDVVSTTWNWLGGRIKFYNRSKDYYLETKEGETKKKPRSLQALNIAGRRIFTRLTPKGAYWPK